MSRAIMRVTDVALRNGRAVREATVKQPRLDRERDGSPYLSYLRKVRISPSASDDVRAPLSRGEIPSPRRRRLVAPRRLSTF